MMDIIELTGAYSATDYRANTALTETEAEIYYVLKEIAEAIPNHTSNTEWTYQIKDKIGKLGEKKGFEVYPSFQNSELLYDVVWCSKSTEGYLQHAELILESELNHRPTHNGLRWDFEKLLIGNAENRVLICFNYDNYNSDNPPLNMINAIQWFNDCCKHLKKSDNGSRVLIIIIDDYGADIVPHVINI